MHYQDLPGKEGGYTRTGSRTPMQWSRGLNCGFSGADSRTLYLPVEQGADVPTVETQEEREDSLLHMVRDLLNFRKQHECFFDHTNLTIVSADPDRRSFAYQRGSLLMLCNPAGETEQIVLSGLPWKTWKKVYEIGQGTWEGERCLLEAQSFVIYEMGGEQ
jgi:maltose alpha-D-glucosyltransferase/alpha-amylase